jgi:hypothetical protein
MSPFCSKKRSCFEIKIADHPNMADALDNFQSLPRVRVSNLHSRSLFQEKRTNSFAPYLCATARNRAISDPFDFRAAPPFICTNMKSKRSPVLEGRVSRPSCPFGSPGCPRCHAIRHRLSRETKRISTAAPLGPKELEKDLRPTTSIRRLFLWCRISFSRHCAS